MKIETDNGTVDVTRDVYLDEDRRLGRVPEQWKAKKCIVSRRVYKDGLGVEQWSEWKVWADIRNGDLCDTLILLANRKHPDFSGYAEALLEADWGDTDRLPVTVSGLVYFGVPRATREFAVAEFRETIELL